MAISAPSFGQSSARSHHSSRVSWDEGLSNGVKEMGVGMSGGTNGEGLTLEGLMEEANQVLSKATEVITQTIEAEIGDLRNLHESIGTKVASTYAAIQDKLAELSRYSEEAQACVQRKEAELQGIQVKMKNTLLECYSRHAEALEKLRPERAIIHEEAKQFKLEAQNIIQNCMRSEDRLECFHQGLTDLGKRADVLLKKFEAHMKREVEIQSKNTKLFLDCEKKAIADADKAFTRVIEEVKKCGQNGINKN